MRPLGAQHHTGYSEVRKLPITHGKRALRLAPARRASSRRSLSLSRSIPSLPIAGPSRSPYPRRTDTTARRGPARRFAPAAVVARTTAPTRSATTSHATSSMADAASSMRPPPGWPSGASRGLSDHSLASAFGDLIDNPREARHARRALAPSRTRPPRGRDPALVRLGAWPQGLRASEERAGGGRVGRIGEAASSVTGLERHRRHSPPARGAQRGAPGRAGRASHAMFSKEMQARAALPQDGPPRRTICRYYRGGRGGETWLLDVDEAARIPPEAPLRVVAVPGPRREMGALDRYAHAGARMCYHGRHARPADAQA